MFLKSEINSFHLIDLYSERWTNKSEKFCKDKVATTSVETLNLDY